MEEDECCVVVGGDEAAAVPDHCGDELGGVVNNICDVVTMTVRDGQKKRGKQGKRGADFLHRGGEW